jgi:hypothetical protein
LFSRIPPIPGADWANREFPAQRPEVVVEHRVPAGHAEQAGPFLYMACPAKFPAEIEEFETFKERIIKIKINHYTTP